MNKISKIYVLGVLAFLYLPILVLVIFSFNSSRLPTLPWKGFTFKWYEAALQNEQLVSSFKHSLIVAFTSSIIATTLGFLSAYFLRNWRSKYNITYLGLICLPAGTPLILLGFGLLMFFKQINISGSIEIVIIGHTVLTSPFAVGIIRVRLLDLDMDIEHAARNLGASEFQLLTKIIIPQSLPAIAGAASLSFLISWDEFVIAWFLSGFDATLPVSIWAMLKSTINPQINAIGSIALFISIIFIVSVFIFLPLALKGLKKYKRM